MIFFAEHVNMRLRSPPASKTHHIRELLVVGYRARDGWGIFTHVDASEPERAEEIKRGWLAAFPDHRFEVVTPEQFPQLIASTPAEPPQASASSMERAFSHAK
ncbi:MAG: hypothetical protein ACM31O_14115 [Bacteroidota bacterium]